MKVVVKREGNRLGADPHVLAADYKYRRIKRHRAWDQFVIDHGLKPSINAWEFYAIFDKAVAVPFPREAVEIEFDATHMDTLMEPAVPCQITQDAQGVYIIVWANGHHGSNPPGYPPEPDRFVPIEEGE